MKLHLGCWHRYIPGFIHIDLCDFSHIDYKRSIDDLSIFKENSVTLIYSSHSFEYFDRERGIMVLKEWLRVLKPGGSFVVVSHGGPATRMNLLATEDRKWTVQEARLPKAPVAGYESESEVHFIYKCSKN